MKIKLRQLYWSIEINFILWLVIFGYVWAGRQLQMAEKVLTFARAITLIGFLAAVDFSGFLGEGDILGYIFGILIIFVFFAGIPFLTAFSFVLLAEEIMEFSMDYNIQKLYGKMAKKGYDITPRDITNIYPPSAPILKEKIEKQPEDLE